MSLRDRSNTKNDDEDALKKLLDEYPDVVSELADRDSPFARRLRQLYEGGEE